MRPARSGRPTLTMILPGPDRHQLVAKRLLSMKKLPYFRMRQNRQVLQSSDHMPGITRDMPGYADPQRPPLWVQQQRREAV
jgi:hypothetical protein